MTVTEKSAYIKGLAEGLGLNGSTPEAKVIAALIDLVSELSEKVVELEEENETLNAYIEEIDEDLGSLEELIYDDDDDEEDDEDDDEEDLLGCDLDCAHCTHPEDCEDDEDEEDGFRCLMCPSCGERIYFDETMDPSDLLCPACGKAVCEDEEADGADDVK